MSRNPRNGGKKKKTKKKAPESGPEWYPEIIESDFDGGPIDSSVLHSFGNHISHTIWETGKNPRDVKKYTIHHRASAFELWPLAEERNKSMKRACRKSGLENLWKCHSPFINKPLIHALLERFMPETNTFHFPFGEATITLDDMYKITKLKIDGEVLEGGRVTGPDGALLLKNLLGVGEVEAKEAAKDGNVSLTWLRENFKGNCDENEGDEVTIGRHVRAYLLYVLGETLFTDKSGGKVSLALLRDLENLEAVEHKAWGLAGLVYLYKQLSISSDKDVQQLCGYVQILEIWACLHIPDIMPLNPAPHPQWNPKRAEKENHTPYLLRYSWLKSANTVDKLLEYRMLFDDLTDAEDRFCWYPYEFLEFQRITLFSGYLVCHEDLQPHPVDRVMRQFGKKQDIPSVGRRVLKKKLAIPSSEEIVAWLTDMLVRYQEFVPQRPGHGLEIDEYMDPCKTDEYMAWYVRITHLKVNPPSSVERGVETQYMEEVRQESGEEIEEDQNKFGEQLEEYPGLTEVLGSILSSLMLLES